MSSLKIHLKRLLLWSLFLCTSGSSYAQQFDWATGFGGLGLDVGRAICTDPDGNVIVVGSFSGSAHVADTFLVGYGNMEAFVAKFTAEGQFLWARVISGDKEDMARGVVCDITGSIYVTGHYTDTVVFQVTETDTISASSAGDQDLFIAKYDAQGNFLWYRRAGGKGNDTGTDIAYAPWDGKLYISGGFEKRAVFGYTSLLSLGLSDAFLLKIDPDGNFHWVKSGGGPEHDIASSVAVEEPTGDIFIAGDYYESAQFGGEQLVSMGSSDIFLAHFNADGQQVWIRTCGGTDVDVATNVGCDLNGNAFVSGYYQGLTFFQNHSVSALSYNDVFLSKFDDDGNCVWLQSAGSYGLDNCLGMDVAWDGTCYLTGLFEELIVAQNDTALGNGYDIYLISISPDGNVNYAHSAGAGSADIGMAVCLGLNDCLFVTGYYYYQADFDGNIIGYADHGDAFLSRFCGVSSVFEQSVVMNTECFVYNSETKILTCLCAHVGPWSVYDSLGRIFGSNSGASSLIVESAISFVQTLYGGVRLLSLRN